MMAHKVRVLYSPTQKTIRMHYASEYNNKLINFIEKRFFFKILVILSFKITS